MTAWSPRHQRHVQDLRRARRELDRLADGKTYTFKLKPDLKFASGNPITAEDVAYSFQRAVKLDKRPAFILTQFGLTKDNVKDKVKQTGPLELTSRSTRPMRRASCSTA